MEWQQLLAIIGSNLAIVIVGFGFTFTVFSWSRAEANEDRRHMDEKLQKQIESIRLTSEQSRRESNEILKSIHDEMKDFHIRLIKIEESKVREKS